MELRHLQTLLAIRDRESFTAAAKSLGITQAAVSQHVAGMEESLGVRLFDRQGRSIRLTSAGKKLCQHADRILELVATAEADVKGHPLSVQGPLRIASSTVPAATILPRLLNEFRRQFPGVQPKLEISDSEAAVNAVNRREADVGFAGILPKVKGLTPLCVAEDELVLVAAPDHPLAQRKSVSLKQLATSALVVREPNSGSYRCLDNALGPHGRSLSEMQVAMQANSNEAIVSAVRAGTGVAFLSSAVVDDLVQSGGLAVVKVRALRPRRKLYMIVPPGADGREPLRSFVEFVQVATQ